MAARLLALLAAAAMVGGALAGSAQTAVEAAGTTADRLVQGGGDPGIEGWVTVGPWARMVDEARVRAGKPALFTTASALARSPVAVVVWPDREKVLETRCGGPLTWRCLGDVAKGATWQRSGGPSAWGPVKVGVDDPHSSGVGL